GTSITWGSDKSSIVAVNGTVTRPSYTAGDALVTLTATIKKGSVEETKTFTLTVTKLAQTDTEAVAAAKAAVEVGYASGDSASDVKQNLTLSTAGLDGTS
ncbi:immunoglobulin-like domain-containing protein, partial [Paenibacillus sp. CCS19]|uniref:immunoglobulin-like domain-containing protein n=1 Tax=Paenibacillus sp. CCS19 TaxID=3158387 RepID=UPI00295E7F4F